MSTQFFIFGNWTRQFQLIFHLNEQFPGSQVGEFPSSPRLEGCIEDSSKIPFFHSTVLLVDFVLKRVFRVKTLKIKKVKKNLPLFRKCIIRDASSWCGDPHHTDVKVLLILKIYRKYTYLRLSYVTSISIIPSSRIFLLIMEQIF